MEKGEKITQIKYILCATYFHIPSHLNPHKNYSRQAQRSQATCPKSHSKSMALLVAPTHCRGSKQMHFGKMLMSGSGWKYTVERCWTRGSALASARTCFPQREKALKIA